MTSKGFADNQDNIDTPNDISVSKKPLESNLDIGKKVDINVLKARAQLVQDKENKKNIFIFIFFLTLLGAVGVYLSI